MFSSQVASDVAQFPRRMGSGPYITVIERFCLKLKYLEQPFDKFCITFSEAYSGLITIICMLKSEHEHFA